MILSDRKIEELSNIGDGADLITPFESRLLNPSSYDLTWNGTVREAITYPSLRGWKTKWLDVRWADALVMKPFHFYLLGVEQLISVPDDIQANVTLKSTTARKGVQAMLAGLADPGFSGYLTLEMYTVGPLVQFVKGQRICQISFNWLDEPAASPYGKERGSHYQNQPFFPVRAYDEQETKTK